MSSMAPGKRKYKSGAQKKSLATILNKHFFQMKDNGDYNEDPTSNSIAEVKDDSFCDKAEKYLVNSSICPESSHGVTIDKEENFTPSEVCSTSEAKSADKKKDVVFDTTRKFPTDRDHFMENITDRDLKTLIMHTSHADL